jgi:putative oxidoreductase
MKFLPPVAGLILGGLFIMSGVVVLFELVDVPEIPKETPIGAFMAAMGPTGYMTFIKILEVLGGLLVAIPLTRNLGLLILGPIIVNIIAFHLFLAGGVKDLASPMLLAIILLSIYLLFVERKAFAALFCREK